MNRIRRWLLVLVGLFGACSESTGGGLVNLPFKAGGVSRGTLDPLRFDTPLGWSVSLEVARVAIGPIYLNTTAPPTDAFRGGLVIVQVTRQTVVDALYPGLRNLPDGADGQTGHAVAAEIGLLPPDASIAEADRALLGAGVAHVAGTAAKGDQTLPFAGNVIIDGSQATAQLPLVALQRINGAVVDLTFTGDPQTLLLRVDPTHWFDDVDFGELTADGPDGDGRYSWSPHSSFDAKLVEGLKRTTGVYQFQLRTP